MKMPETASTNKWLYDKVFIVHRTIIIINIIFNRGKQNLDEYFVGVSLELQIISSS